MEADEDEDRHSGTSEEAAPLQLTTPQSDEDGGRRRRSQSKTKTDSLWGQRTIRNEEDKMLFSLGHSAESFVVSLLSDQLAQPEGTVNAS